jgi:cyclopropane-fatty-acyl-phospholipid synthase
MKYMMNTLIERAETGRLPKRAVRLGIRARIARRVSQLNSGTVEDFSQRQRVLMAERASGPITTHTAEANEQHYEVPTEYFQAVLGPRLKYSSAYWPAGTTTLSQAEEAMLGLTCDRARLADGQRVLELGCGWGSLTLWMAERYPGSEIVAVSNSATQREHITAEAGRRGLKNVVVFTADVADFEPEGHFDRVVSVEMFEHVNNHRALMAKVAGWLKTDGLAFVHIFTNRSGSWAFETTSERDWMGRYFFSGGVMPADDLLLHEQRDLVVEDHWRLDGTHYAKTLAAWRETHEQRQDEIVALFSSPDAYGEDAERWYWRWWLFHLACEELFAYRGGSEFWVSHYLFSPRSPSSR